MAYFTNLEEERKKKDAGGNQALITNYQQTSGGVPPVQSTSGWATPQSTLSGNPTQGVGSGKFVNFDRVFGANQSTAQNMAQNAVQNISKTADKAAQGITTAQQGFNQAVSDGSRGQASITKNAQGEMGGRYGVQNASYTGPNDLKSYLGQEKTGTLQQGIENANTQLGLTKDAYGLQTYLQNQNQNGNYSNGMSKWDAALLGQAGGQDFARMRNKYGNLDSMFDQAQNASFNTADQGKLTVGQQNDAAANQALAKNNTDIENAQADAEEQKRIQQAYEAWQAALRNGDANAQTYRDQYFRMQNDYQSRVKQRQDAENKADDPWYQQNVASHDVPVSNQDELTEEQKQENIQKYGNPNGLK